MEKAEKKDVHCISKDALHIGSTKKLSWEKTYKEMTQLESEQEEWADWVNLDIDLEIYL